MNIPGNKNNQTTDGGPFNPESGKKQLTEIIHANVECQEIKVQLENNKVSRIFATQQVIVSNDTNIEKICRQFANQDVLIKIRNGKKITVEQTKIIKP